MDVISGLLSSLTVPGKAPFYPGQRAKRIAITKRLIIDEIFGHIEIRAVGIPPNDSEVIYLAELKELREELKG